jgi:hypothetical protein
LAVLELPVVFNVSAAVPVAVLEKPVVLPKSAWKPVAVLPLPVALLMSASSPRTVFWFVKQPSWQTARACGDEEKYKNDKK